MHIHNWIIFECTVEVLWKAGCTKIRIACFFYHNPADIAVWLQPTASAQRKDRTQNAGSWRAFAVCKPDMQKTKQRFVRAT